MDDSSTVILLSPLKPVPSKILMPLDANAPTDGTTSSNTTMSEMMAGARRRLAAGTEGGWLDAKLVPTDETTSLNVTMSEVIPRADGGWPIAIIEGIESIPLDINGCIISVAEFDLPDLIKDPVRLTTFPETVDAALAGGFDANPLERSAPSNFESFIGPQRIKPQAADRRILTDCSLYLIQRLFTIINFKYVGIMPKERCRFTLD